MKSDAQIDAIMAAIPKAWQRYWCGASFCACKGCVQTGNKAVIFQKIAGRQYSGDPEYINEAALKLQGALYSDNKLTREEWQSWMNRQRQQVVTDSLNIVAGTEWDAIANAANMPTIPFFIRNKLKTNDVLRWENEHGIQRWFINNIEIKGSP